ncbi:porin [Candidatus Methylopumilus universalis]|nr:porin [Candidatus Methylopumilus universalis]QDC76248.1 porin [Candidatus Methylopumilus universalis]
MFCQLRLAYRKTAAGAVLALSATAANAGIIIPAGEWTIDIGGNVNSFFSQSRARGNANVYGGIAGGGNSASVNSQGTGLLPNFLSVSGSTRQNDLDVTWLISIQPGGDVGSAGQYGTQNNRQAYLTFGDKSWGSVKLGKDLGVFASDAILNDMTLLGVGAGAGLGNATYGRIGTGFQYADWKSQVAYTTPNMNGFQATIALTQGWNATATTNAGSLSTSQRGGSNPAYEGKASYSFAANDVTGKVWVSGIGQKIGGGTVATDDPVAYAADIGANVNFAGLGLTGYYYSGQGIGSTFQFLDGYSSAGKARDSDGGYVQATYVLPTKTKAGLSWGQSNLDRASGESNTTLVKTNEMWTAGLYHPLTKHLNLVGEYSHIKSENQAGAENKTNSVSLGGIIFF